MHTKALYGDGDGSGKILSTEFVKKYIQFAKQKFSPALSEDAAAAISQAYADLRARVSSSETDRARTLPITARTLETLIRLASAHAKCHLRHLVTEADAQAAISLLHYALFAEERDAAERDDTAAAEDELGGGGGAGSKRPAADNIGGGGARQRTGPMTAMTAMEMEAAVEATLNEIFAGDRNDVPFDELCTRLIRKEPRAVQAGREVVEEALFAMEAANKVMYREGVIHLV
jgi:DNA replication licensing factor MCM3